MITDGGTKLGEDFQVLKNIDDFCVFGKTLKDLEIQIEKLAKLCRRINLKLAPSKFSLSTAVKFGDTIISAEKIEENSVIFLDPPDNRILAVTEMETPKTKKDVQKLCGMISLYGLITWCATRCAIGNTEPSSLSLVCPWVCHDFLL